MPHQCVRNVWSKSRMTQSRVELLQSGIELTTKVGKQPWCEGDQSRALQEIPQFKLGYKICYNSPPGDSSEN